MTPTEPSEERASDRGVESNAAPTEPSEERASDRGVQRIELFSRDGLPQIRPGDDLAGLLASAYEYADGDVLVVTSKVVSKAEGRVRIGEREAALAEETVRVVARRGNTTIVRNRLGLTMAAAGIDASNVEAGSIVLLPTDPDASAREIRERLYRETGYNVAVVITDTAGRAWRDGQTDIAIGAAGLLVAESFDGRTDPHGNDLVVTLPAVADEIAGAAELIQGKLGGRPSALLRGRADLVLPIGDHGLGAASLIRPEGTDLFGLGAREAVLQALRGAGNQRLPFGAPVETNELLEVLGRLTGTTITLSGRAEDGSTVLEFSAPPGAPSPPVERVALAALCFAHGWQVIRPPDSSDPVVAHVSPVFP